MFGKSESYSLGHFDVSCRTVFNTGCFGFVQSFASKGTDTAIKATSDQVVVHAVRMMIVMEWLFDLAGIHKMRGVKMEKEMKAGMSAHPLKYS